MKLKITVIISALLFVCIVLSCESMSVGSQNAGAKGIIPQNTANAISLSAKSIKTAIESITPEQEYYIGRAVAANIVKTYRVYNGKPALTAYLNRICLAITVNSPRPNIYNGYRVAILDSNEINAFATSGGHIFVTRGLINAAKTEDALAGVIAHEVAHIQLKHSIKAIKSSRISQAILTTGAAASEVVSGVAGHVGEVVSEKVTEMNTKVSEATGFDVKQFTNTLNDSVNDIVSTMLNSGYSQAQEFEADNTALSLMASAGYNPSGLLEMLYALKDIQTKDSGFGKTHPSPAQRIRNAERAIKNFHVTDTASARQRRFATATR